MKAGLKIYFLASYSIFKILSLVCEPKKLLFPMRMYEIQPISEWSGVRFGSHLAFVAVSFLFLCYDVYFSEHDDI